MSPIGGPHAYFVRTLIDLISAQLDRSVLIDVQNPIQLDERTQLHPDIMLILRERSSRLIPTPSDVVLVVEVSDSTLAFDRRVKAPLYADAAIPELWVVDVAGERVLRHTEPTQDRYQSVVEVRRGERMLSQVSRTLTIEIAIDTLFS